MLEILRKISRMSERPHNNIIFLINGAEEEGLLGALVFLTHHKWSKDAKIVINLDSCGAASREILFQIGGTIPSLLEYYSQVPHPFAQTIAEELYQNGFVSRVSDYVMFNLKKFTGKFITYYYIIY